MPTYIFTCTRCKKVHEYVYSFKDLEEIEDKLVCERCGGPLKRKLAPFVTHFNYTRKK